MAIIFAKYVVFLIVIQNNIAFLNDMRKRQYILVNKCHKISEVKNMPNFEFIKTFIFALKYAKNQHILQR